MAHLFTYADVAALRPDVRRTAAATRRGRERASRWQDCIAQGWR